MKIVLNDKLVLTKADTVNVRSLIQQHTKKISRVAGFSANTHCIGMMIPENAEVLQTGWVSMLADAYSRHEKVRVAPHDLWFIVLGDVAKYVNSNSQKFRHLFTANESKTRITVQTSDCTHLPIDEVLDQLRTLVPSDVDIFIPKLSTMGEDEKVAMHAVFCDMVKSYYSYSTLMCGLPAVEITGTEADWGQLVDKTIRIAEVMADETITLYMHRVGDIFKRLQSIVARDELSESELEWVRSIFSQRNVGSGGDKEIDGWVRHLFLNNTQRRIEAFQFSMAVVPYRNIETGRDFSAIYGAFSRLRTKDDFVYAGYSHAIFEHLSI